MNREQKMPAPAIALLAQQADRPTLLAHLTLPQTLDCQNSASMVELACTLSPIETHGRLPVGK